MPIILSSSVNNECGWAFSTEILYTLKALCIPNGDRRKREDEKGMHYVCMACVNIQKANMPLVSLHTHS